jgi:hypothetical protein
MECESDWWVDFGLDQPSLDKVNLDQDRAPHTRSHLIKDLLDGRRRQRTL